MRDKKTRSDSPVSASAMHPHLEADQTEPLGGLARFGSTPGPTPPALEDCSAAQSRHLGLQWALSGIQPSLGLGRSAAAPGHKPPVQNVSS
jgi:hypothetical protein